MASKSRYIIRRKDSEVDDAFLDSEGLTIGRLISNDLVLNHRAVSRTHAGIANAANIPSLAEAAETAATYFLFNLSASNGTLLNGENVENVALFDGDVIQIGPYLLKVNYLDDALALTVEMELKVQPLEKRTALLQLPAGQDGDKTMLIKFPTVAGRPGTAMLSGQGLLTGYLPSLDKQALDLFWDKRKREAGKIEAKSPLHPRFGQKYGKAQFNWRPTFDLRRLWRSAYFVWGTLVTAALAVAAAFAYSNAYAPKPLSTAHAQPLSAASLQQRNLAARSNGNACTSCHTPQAGMLDQCIACHQTKATAARPGFAPAVYIKGHENQGLGCLDCHSEHMGPQNETGLLHYGLCYNCHNGVYRLKQAGQSRQAGDILPIPHGGAVGYVKVKDKGFAPEYWGLSLNKWSQIVARWKAKAPQKFYPTAEVLSRGDSKQQFHNLHMEGLDQPRLCATCHFNEQGEREIQSNYGLHEAPKQACSKCHAEPQAATGVVRGLAKCDTCHQQHGRTSQPVTLAPESETDLQKYLALLSPRAKTVAEFNLKGRAGQARIGSASALRQSGDAPSWRNFGALPWYGWLALLALLPVGGLLFVAADAVRRKFSQPPATEETLAAPKTTRIKLTASQQKQKDEGPLYPRPVVDPLLCIGCHACVEACPHDVLAITADGVAAPVNADQCMEDTSCQVECPTSPKACVVVHTTKIIPDRQVPKRDQQFMTNVPGIYLIGDVSGVPLIKNAINEGAQVIEAVKTELAHEGSASQADYDVAIIGMGPAGLSATVSAKQQGLRYLALEQDQVAATIQNTYGKGKFVFYKPDTVEVRGGLPLFPDPNKKEGNFKEPMLEGWQATLKREGIQINERESCKDLQREDGQFRILTEKGTLKQPAAYTARKVVLAIGNRGTPMLLKAPGEELKVRLQRVGRFCNSCGAASHGEQAFCAKCGEKLPVLNVEESKVQYKLGDPKEFMGKHCTVVGAGNSAIEVAVALTGFERQGDQISFANDAEVTLIVRSDLKGDLKLGNKMNFYDCLDAGRIKAYFRTTIKRIEADTVVLMDAKTEAEKATVPCDFVFALIGGDKPTTFLEKLGIEILGKRKVPRA
ncbi:MAG: NAD(P)-binding domain-containing protein [Acidobacteria bacterium]|nr:NAD(P)-binding domain-containing protein [Acidobacteriota bacterium]MBI3423363.1 NAD(P)-binding domain-containing protein [Acidobacteriota bacterium]